MLNLTRSQKIRRTMVALAVAVLPASALMASCAPTPPPCPGLKDGGWTGTWDSTVFPTAGGYITAVTSTSGSAVSGTVQLQGSVLTDPMPIDGTVACDRVEVTTPYGITLTGRISADGESVSGTYESTSPADTGSFTITAD